MVALTHSPLPRNPLAISRKQAEFRQSKAWLRGFVGGRGSGKTRIGATDILLSAKNGDPWMSVSPSYVVIEETTWPTFREIAEQMGVWIGGRMKPTPRARFRTQDGGTAEIVFRSGDKPETLRGPNKAGLWLDEASIMSEQVFTIGLPVLRYKGRMGRCLMTFTPRGRRHWTFGAFYDRVNEEDAVRERESNGHDLETLAGMWFRRKRNTHLVRSATWENPFLPPEFMEMIGGRYSSTLAAQELGGEFVEIDGLIFRREWYEFVDFSPRVALRVRYWDRAATPGGGCYTAGVLMSRAPDGIFYIEDCVRGQWGPGERDRIIHETATRDAERYGNEVMIYIEQEGGSGGVEVADQAVKKLAGFPVYSDSVSRGRMFRNVGNLQLPGEAKIVRAMPHAAQAEAGNVKIVRGRWNGNWLDEHCEFPESTYADQVDASSGAFNKLAGRGSIDVSGVARFNVPVETGERFGKLAETSPADVAAMLLASRAKRIGAG